MLPKTELVILSGRRYQPKRVSLKIFDFKIKYVCVGVVIIVDKETKQEIMVITGVNQALA